MMNIEALLLSAVCSRKEHLFIKCIAAPRVLSTSKGVGLGPASRQTAGQHGLIQCRITQVSTVGALNKSRTGE